MSKDDILRGAQGLLETVNRLLSSRRQAHMPPPPRHMLMLHRVPPLEDDQDPSDEDVEK